MHRDKTDCASVNMCSRNEVKCIFHKMPLAIHFSKNKVGLSEVKPLLKTSLGISFRCTMFSGSSVELLEAGCFGEDGVALQDH